jgi:hypothetical protein
MQPDRLNVNHECLTPDQTGRSVYDERLSHFMVTDGIDRDIRILKTSPRHTECCNHQNNTHKQVWENRYNSLIDHTADFSYGELLDEFPYSKVLTVTLYDQDNSYYCVPAVGQMIADYYGVTHSQSHIATQMNTTNVTYISNDTFGELRYYINNPSDCLGKEDSYYEVAGSSTWTRVQGEIDDDRPFDSRIVGHARVCKGYMVTDIDSNWILVNDPWPVGTGDIFWEMWNYVNHNIYNVYVQ